VNNVRVKFKWCKPSFHAKGVGQSVADVGAGCVDAHGDLYVVGIVGHNARTSRSIIIPYLINSQGEK
jgi:hypothetical protein